MLVWHNVICFGCFILWVIANKKTPPIVSLNPSPLQGFHQGLFFVLREMLYQPSFVLIRLLQKLMHFQNKTTFFFQLTADLAVLCICVS